MSRRDQYATRRSFLASSVGAAAGGALLSGAVAAPAGAAPVRRPDRYRESGRVDLHCHYIPDFYRALLGQYGQLDPVGIPVPSWSPQDALRFMGQHGIAVQMLSISDPGVQFVPLDQQAALAARCNDYVKTVLDAHPGRFGAFGVLPLDDPAASASEAVRCLDVLKLDGVGLLSHSLGYYPGDPRFEALLSELDRRRAWVFVHPTTVAMTNLPQDGAPLFAAEFPFDTTRALMSLLFNGAFERHRRIRWQFAHGGGTIAMLRGRLASLTGAAKRYGPLLGLPKGASVLTASSATDSLRRGHYDTALIADAPELDAVVAMSGVDRIVFGSDWPFASVLYSPRVQDPQPGLSQVFTNPERHRIDRLNARDQFPRLRHVLPAALR